MGQGQHDSARNKSFVLFGAKTTFWKQGSQRAIIPPRLKNSLDSNFSLQNFAVNN
jgi:hypothetical protein